MNFKNYEDILNRDLQSYCKFMHNSVKNIKERELVFYLQKEAEPNAYAAYHSNCDMIEMDEVLFSELYNLILNNFEDNDRASHILYNAFNFFTFHELGHLYLGHCQLSQSKSMSAFPSHIKTNFTSSDNIVMEMDADMFASRRNAEKVAQMIKNSTYKTDSSYTNPMEFCLDALVGICAVFFAIDYWLARLEKFNEGYPSSSIRCYYSGIIFLQHIKYFLDIKIEKDAFIKILISSEEIFGGFTLDPDRKKIKYGAIIDGSIDDEIKRAIKYWQSNLKPRLKKISRIPLSKMIVIDYP